MTDTQVKATRTRFKGELTISDVADEAPIVRQNVDLTQFLAILNSSYEGFKATGKATPKGITVPAQASQLVETRFRQAAKEIGCGLTIDVYDHLHPRGRERAIQPGQVRIVVEARAKKNTGPRPKANAESTPKATKGLPPVSHPGGRK